MGNQTSRSVQPESLLGDLPDVVYKDSLGGGRFFKSSLCVHDEGGLVVVKTYAKRPDFPDVKPYEDRLVEIRAALAGAMEPHVWPTQRVYHSDRAVYLVRQYLFSTLAARVTTRPFLTPPEKRWLAYQVLHGVAQAHDAGVCHGDIKAENVLVTSWEWALIADFAPYKPTLLPADNPADFSFFFDTGGRRKCCLAPERFYDPGPAAPTPAQARAARLTPAMDVFAAGCVVAELFADGQPLFDYSRLLEYRRGAYDPGPTLSLLGTEVGAIVAHMTQRDPSARLTARQYLHQFREAVLPQDVVLVVGPLMAELVSMDPDTRAATVAQRYAGICSRLEGGLAVEGQAADGGEGAGSAAAAEPPAAEAASPRAQAQGTARPTSLQAEAAALLAEAQSLLRDVGVGSTRSRDAAASADAARAVPVPLGPPATPFPGPPAPPPATAAPQPVNDSLVLLTVLLCSLLRGCRLQEVRVRLLGMLGDCAARCGDDDTRLHRVLPHLVAAAAEPQAAAVRCAALRAVPPLLKAIQRLPAGEARMFGDYLLPSLSLLPAEGEGAVQAEYAALVGPLAAQARDFLESLQRRGRGDRGGGDMAVTLPPGGTYDQEAARLHAGVERAVHDLLVGPRAEAKLALLPHLVELSVALGRRDTADGLLPALLTVFNSREWQVRAALYEHLQGVCPALGPDGVAASLLPFLERMLSDPEPAAVTEAARLLGGLAEQGLLHQRHLLAAVREVCAAGLLQSPCTAVRAAAVRFLAAAGAAMAPAAVQALLVPHVQPQLAAQPPSFSCPAALARAVGGGFELKPSTGGPRPTAAAGIPAATTPPPTQPLPTASYTLPLDGQYLRPGASHLDSALEQAAATPTGAVAAPPASAAGAAPLVSRARRSLMLPADVADVMVRSQMVGPAGRGASSMGAAHSGAGSARAAGEGPDTRAPSPAPWYPQGVLVAHLAEHKKPITRLAAAQDGRFFVSASADGTAKVWDCRRLERDVSFRSRLTYAAHAGAVTAVAALATADTVATGCSDGSVHVWRVECTERGGVDRYSGISGVRQFCSEQGAVLDLAGWGPHMVVASLQRVGVVAWDLRAPSAAPLWTLPAPPSDGVVTRFCCDPGPGRNWVVTGSSRGALCLWDLRFMLEVSRWTHPTGSGIDAMALAGGPPPPEGPLVFVAAGEAEAALWDLGDASCKQVLRVLPHDAPESLRRQPPAALAAPTPVRRAVDVMGHARQLGIAELQAPQPRKGGFRALLPTAGGQLLTAGSDRVLRCWDCARPSHSCVVTAPLPSGATPEYSYATRTVQGVPVVEETCALMPVPSGGDNHQGSMAWSERAAALCHEQAVADIVAGPRHMLISGGLDGVVKVWR